MFKFDEKMIQTLTANPIILDFGNVSSFSDVLEEVKEKFSFWQYEVQNRFDVKKMLEYVFKNREDDFKERCANVIIVNFFAMPKTLQKESFKILEIFYQLEKVSPNFKYILPDCRNGKFPDEYYQFKIITANPIILDFSRCKTLGEFHLILKENFGFPEYYGENWDALWDCFRGLFDEKTHTIIRGFFSMSEDLQEHCSIFFEILDDLCQDELNFSYSVES
ncbi:MAG: barstar family protein [Oscillospiraceae bacterium]|nr:barstar family protein [Oscillospiraceae bacterium]